MNNVLAFVYLGTLCILLIFLWYAGDRTVRYAHETSRLFNISTAFIGFVLLAISTGLPELAVAISSILSGVPELSAGDIIGSNFTDISLVLGVPIFISGTIFVPKREKAFFITMLLITTVLMMVVFFLGTIGRLHGLFLIAIYFVCMWRLWKTHRVKETIEIKIDQLMPQKKKKGFFQSRKGILLKLIISLGGLIVASTLSVQIAIRLAKLFALPLEIVGSTLFAVGTSLPELSISLNAIRRKDYSLALGNALGSVFEQGTLILGLLAFLSPKPINLLLLRSSAPFMFLAFGVVGFGMFQRNKINRFDGGVLLILFFLFWIWNYRLRFAF